MNGLALAKGQAYLGDGNIDAAAEEFSRILSDGPKGMDRVNALYGYAECCTQRGQWDEAWAYYRAVLCEFPLHDGALHRIQEIEDMKAKKKMKKVKKVKKEEQEQRRDGPATKRAKIE